MPKSYHFYIHHCNTGRGYAACMEHDHVSLAIISRNGETSYKCVEGREDTCKSSLLFTAVTDSSEIRERYLGMESRFKRVHALHSRAACHQIVGLYLRSLP